MRPARKPASSPQRIGRLIGKGAYSIVGVCALLDCGVAVVFGVDTVFIDP